MTEATSAETDSRTASDTPKRGVQHVARVERWDLLTPNVVSLYLGGQGIAAFFVNADPAKPAATGRYVKMLFAKRPRAGHRGRTVERG